MATDHRRRKREGSLPGRLSADDNGMLRKIRGNALPDYATMNYHGSVTLIRSVCNKHHGITFRIKPFESVANKSWSEMQNAQQMAIRSFFRQMKAAKNDKKELLYEGVEAEELKTEIFMIIPEPEPEPVIVEKIAGQGSLF